MKRCCILFVWIATLPSTAQNVEVKGIVRSLNNIPIGGVNVLVKGTNIGTATDMSGAFALSVPADKIVLLIMYAKQKPLEEELSIRPGYQYYIDIQLAHKSHTFNKSVAVMSELPLDCPRIRGRVVDQDGRVLPGLMIRQEKSTFTATTDLEGTFDLPAPAGENRLLLTAPGFKPLAFALSLHEAADYFVSISLVKDNHQHRRGQSLAKITGETRR